VTANAREDGFRATASGDTFSMLGKWLKRGEKNRADKQQGDVHALDVQGDPRGGVQSEEYRHADPRDVVEEDGVVMSGPGGAPQEDSTPEERRRQQRS
jgi:hypothetical protein